MVRVAIAQLAPALGDVERNLRMHLDRIEAAREAGASLIVFPELSLTGTFLQDLTEDVAMAAEDPVLAQLAEASRAIDVVAGYVAREGALALNAAGYWSRGELRHRHDKAYLTTTGSFAETPFLSPGSRLRAFDGPLGRSALLIGDDLRHPSTVEIVARDGAEWLIAVAANPAIGFAGDRPESARVWEQLLDVHARLHGLPVVFANRVGFEDGVGFAGGSGIVDPFGKDVVRPPYFDEALILADLDLGAYRRARRFMSPVRDARPDLTLSELQRAVTPHA